MDLIYKTNNGLLVNNSRVFLPSADINIFPCSRRGQFQIDDRVIQYDPEARLNTEYTNRLHTATNGFKDSFIVKNDFTSGDSLEFILAGYRIKINSFDPSKILAAFIDAGIDISGSDKIYAHLGIQGGIALSTTDYFTEILYRQFTNTSDNTAIINYLDVSYGETAFFVGVSFVTTDKINTDKEATPYFLQLFSKSGEGDWELTQTSLLPKVEHDTEPDSIKLSGDFTVKHGEQISFKVTQDETVLGPTVMSSLIVGEKAESDTFANGTIKVKEHIETPTLEATTSIKTPLLNVDTIASSSGEEIKVTSAIALDSTLKVDDEATLNSGLKVTNGDTVLKKLSAEETSLDSLVIAGEAADDSILTVNGNTTITDNLEVFGTTSVPTLKVDTITTNANSEITVESSLKVTGKATLTDELEVTKKATLSNGLQVTNSDTDLQKLTATELAVATDVLIVTKDDAKFTKPITVDSSLTANNVQIKDQGQVPALELYHFKNGPYQLQFKFNTAPTIIEEE